MRNVPDGCPLSTRQLEVALLLCEGLTHQEIGRKIGVKASTVRTHTMHAFRKLNVSNGAQLVATLGQQGWIGWKPPAPEPKPEEQASPLATEFPYLAGYLQDFESSRWPHEPDERSRLGMKLALAAHRNQRGRRT